MTTKVSPLSRSKKKSIVLSKAMFITTLLTSLILAGCNDQFRYPCQDPRNWDEPFCKKPMCSSNGTCPEDLHHYLKDKDKKAVPMNNNIGACK